MDVVKVLLCAALILGVLQPVEAERKITINMRYLYLPVKDGAQMRKFSLTVDGKPVRVFDIELAPEKPDFHAFLNVEQWKGKTASIRVEPDVDGSSLLEGIIESDDVIGKETFYREKFRPQFHYSPRIGWVNDPNGCVYYKGEYHLFYQHNPYGLKWGNMHWGHAVSKDLVHWQELPEALYPDDLGTMFSGSAAVDWDNTSGLQKGKEKTIFTFYTAAGNPFTQCMAYSSDRGRTWTKYEGNPILPNVVTGNRDPKVLWHKSSRQWIMVIYKDEDTFGFFGSPDLKKWTHLSDLKLPGFHECPDMFEMPVDNNPQNTKWIFMPSYGCWYWDSPRYYIGNFDGRAFSQESGPYDLDLGASAYAGQTFSDTPQSDGRRIFIAWGSRDANEPMYPGNPFNGLFWFPRSLTLRTIQGGLRLHQEPVKEIEKLYSRKHTLKDVVIKPGENALSEIKHDLLDIRAKIDPDKATEVGFNVHGAEIKYDVTSQALSFGGKSAKLPLNDNMLELRILIDRTSVEIFSLDGTFAMSRYFMPDGKSAPITIYARGGDAKAKVLEIHELRSIWK